jgi:3-methyladenine DNA glycosylase AlkD
MHELEALGTVQNRKVYQRHGVGEHQYGVSFANLKSLQKKLKVNQELAQALWATGNHDARVLATLVADPKQVDDSTLEAWAQDLDNYVITDSFSGLVSRTPLARQKMEQWTNAENEWLGQAGWNLLAHLALQDASLPDDYFRPYLKTIERDIHQRQNRVRYSMNNALIAIGMRNSTLQEEAIAAATKIGRVEVDHGETNCKTPDAIAYIHKAAARQRK